MYFDCFNNVYDFEIGDGIFIWMYVDFGSEYILRIYSSDYIFFRCISESMYGYVFKIV